MIFRDLFKGGGVIGVFKGERVDYSYTTLHLHICNCSDHRSVAGPLACHDLSFLPQYNGVYLRGEGDDYS